MFWVLVNFIAYRVVSFIFTLKPSIEAISTFLFIGEYRSNGMAALERFRWCCEEVMPFMQATMDHMPNNNGVSTVT